MPRVVGPSRAAKAASRKPARRRRRSAEMLTWLKVGGVAVGTLAVVGGATWLWTSGAVGRAVTGAGNGILAMTADAGLRVENVLLTGRAESDPAVVLAALGIERGDPILGFDPEEARQRLEGLSWVASATVERRLPDTIFIAIVERSPLALWQRDGRMAVIDGNGAVLTETGLGRFAHLPLVVGRDAQTHAAGLVAALARHPELASRLAAAVRVGGRRWDLRLDNGIEVRLPETGAEAALAWLEEVERTEKLFDRDIVAVDLRLDDRLVIQTSAASAERRRAPKAPEERT